MPVAHLENEWSQAEWAKKINSYIDKGMAKFKEDPRLDLFGSGGSMVADFVTSIMASIQNSCYDRAWWGQIDFTGPMYAAAIIIFRDKKLFQRTTGARFQIWIVDAFNRWNEEQRIEKTLWETVQALGMSKKHEKAINESLAEAYDEAHAETTFIVPESQNPDMVMLQDFIQYWFKDFVFRAWEVLNRAKMWDRDQVKAICGALFQSLCSPEIKCLPHDLCSQMDAPKLMACWAATAERLEILFQQAEAAAKMKEFQPSAKAAKKAAAGASDPMAAASAAAASIAANLSVRL